MELTVSFLFGVAQVNPDALKNLATLESSPPYSFAFLHEHYTPVLPTGDAPFGNTENMSRYEVFNRISEASVPYPFFMNFSLKTLLGGLLEKSDAKRWSYEQVAGSAWLKDVSNV